MKRSITALVATLASLAFIGQASAQNNIEEQTEQTGKEISQETQEAARDVKQETKDAAQEVKQEAQQAEEEIEQKTRQAKTEAKQAQKEPLQAVIEFPKGQAELTPEARQKLIEAIKNAKKDGEVDMAIVATWADRPFPTENDKLTDEANQLAEKRNDKIKEVLQEAGIWNMDTFNMADRTGWLAQWFNTDEAEIKSQFARRQEQRLHESEFRIIEKEGAPSKSVIVLRLESRPEQAD